MSQLCEIPVIWFASTCLDMSLYGLRAASKNWTGKLAEVLGEMGFRRLLSDAAVYFIEAGTPEDSLVFWVHVDDFFLTDRVKKGSGSWRNSEKSSR